MVRPCIVYTPRDCLFLRVNIYLFYQRNYTNAVNTKCYVILKLVNAIFITMHNVAIVEVCMSGINQETLSNLFSD